MWKLLPVKPSYGSAMQKPLPEYTIHLFEICPQRSWLCPLSIDFLAMAGHSPSKEGDPQDFGQAMS